ncbi:glutamate-1-semialdehyde-2,1-aminomutase [Anaeromyxobacter dehalogenans 2CP-1]|uniref:Glutamate-1-semialdehyde 2,1-aminomutase n=1 Tax=Anaeromyxobacter dehalogenans (strain ATCC BAA-258 / DSM 21875 / 2CP-1) TaxID=455488 RepID=GSA_ANAD2|nr:glutamate-1-semialdehyde 2,1-aminomutase [Anaeromyxobacter dehalogenans]B8JCU6.1 RecName: Full=Glutamate-1-semialdehyde 2,1-aminomutase; Short=GSA; AltName: Full=Glutamate-1-semialdehyde aminotransferase; Short=GSA-AT [Anaeromyxobacter dehalogenans 2CP-1]ACL67816.1 glutamate-1-semialdehyde-2,1-aminomutase [Anaeromyxobacter dehalogenans 2CP-1]
MKTELSQKLFEKANDLFPGGVNSPVRAFKGVGGTPRFISRAKGSHIFDVDGNDYVDYVLSWGPMIVGHCHPEVMREVQDAMKEGSSFGAPSPREILLAELVRERMPWVEKMRFVSSGTEATTSAIRVARGFTGRDDIVKFDGCYHGAGDPLLVKAGSGVETLGLPDSPGVPADVARHTLTAPYNDLPALEKVFEAKGASIAAVILEPVVGNMGVLVPRPGFLQGVHDLCRKHGALYIVDEVMTGFRLSSGGACGLYGLRPDLVTFGKVIGAGLPVGAFGGRRDVMDRVAPAGPIYQAGTLSGNPMAMAAGHAALKLMTEAAYRKLEALSAALAEGLQAAAAEANVPVQVNRVGSMLTVFFSDRPVFDAASARACNTRRFGAFFHAMLEHGAYLPPSQFEAAFLSTAHTDDDVARTVAAARLAFAEAAKVA